jgi:hypothetical protein
MIDFRSCPTDDRDFPTIAEIRDFGCKSTRYSNRNAQQGTHFKGSPGQDAAGWYGRVNG